MVEIVKFLPNAMIDYPGKLSAMIFLNKCNYRCLGCQSYEVVNGNPICGEDQVMRFVDGRKGWVDGIIISGGEPTMHGDLGRFISEFKKRGLAVKLDTMEATLKFFRN